MQKSEITINFPVDGFDCRNDYAQQAQAGRSLLMSNVFPFNSDKRIAGGMRPVLTACSVTVPTAAHNGVNNGPWATVTASCLYDHKLVVVDTADYWYMSKRGNKADFDFGVGSGLLDRAASGAFNDTGVKPSGNAKCAFSWNNSSACIIGFSDSLWMFTGNPNRGGDLQCISHEIGIISSQAWTELPDKSIVFLSSQGLYRWTPGNSLPQFVSDARIPGKLSGLTVGEAHVLAYDRSSGGVYIIPSSGICYWMDVESGAFFPFTLAAGESRPIGRINSGGNAVFWIAAGTGVQFVYNAKYSLDSSVLLGPYRISQDGTSASILSELFGQMTGSVSWALYTGDTANEVVSLALAGTPDPEATGTWTSVSSKYWPRSRGEYIAILLSASTGWQFGSMSGIATHAFRMRPGNKVDS